MQAYFTLEVPLAKTIGWLRNEVVSQENGLVDFEAKIPTYLSEIS
ncbi:MULTISPECIES: hypothetical protein [Chromobacterium]|nr:MULTISPECIES: hypothetical protein [Chromobacterium]WON84436.1 hypothetical protein OK026_02635 [Chromobacterium haemolyticum]